MKNMKLILLVVASCSLLSACTWRKDMVVEVETTEATTAAPRETSGETSGLITSNVTNAAGEVVSPEGGTEETEAASAKATEVETEEETTVDYYEGELIEQRMENPEQTKKVELKASRVIEFTERPIDVIDTIEDKTTFGVSDLDYAVYSTFNVKFPESSNFKYELMTAMNKSLLGLEGREELYEQAREAAMVAGTDFNESSVPNGTIWETLSEDMKLSYAYIYAMGCLPEDFPVACGTTQEDFQTYLDRVGVQE